MCQSHAIDSWGTHFKSDWLNLNWPAAVVNMEISLNRKIDTWPKMEHAVTCFCSVEGDFRVLRFFFHFLSINLQHFTWWKTCEIANNIYSNQKLTKQKSFFFQYRNISTLKSIKSWFSICSYIISKLESSIEIMASCNFFYHRKMIKHS